MAFIIKPLVTEKMTKITHMPLRRQALFALYQGWPDQGSEECVQEGNRHSEGGRRN